jgi:hypothetical protein
MVRSGVKVIEPDSATVNPELMALANDFRNG